MSAISSFISAGIGRLKNDLSEPQSDGTTKPPLFVYRGQEYPCVPGTLRRGEVVGLGGRSYTVHFTLHVEQSEFPRALTADMTNITSDTGEYTADYDFPPPPKPGDTVFYPAYPEDDSTEYRVLTRDNSADKSHFVLTIGDMDT